MSAVILDPSTKRIDASDPYRFRVHHLAGFSFATLLVHDLLSVKRTHSHCVSSEGCVLMNSKPPFHVPREICVRSKSSTLPTSGVYSHLRDNIHRSRGYRPRCDKN